MSDCRRLLQFYFTWRMRGFRGYCCRIHIGLSVLLGLQGGDEGGPREVLVGPCRTPHCSLGWGAPWDGCTLDSDLQMRFLACVVVHPSFWKFFHVCSRSHFLRTAVMMYIGQPGMWGLRPGKKEPFILLYTQEFLKRKRSWFPNSGA